MNYLLIGLVGLAMIPLTDWMVDSQPVRHVETAYSKEEVAEMKNLHARYLDNGVLFKSKPVKLYRPKTQQEWADAVAEVWNVDEFKRGQQ